MPDSAKGIIDSFLSQYGLSGLGDWAWNLYTNGSSVEEIMLALRDRPEYKARFPAMDALSKDGRAISEQEYIEYEKQAKQMLHNWGIPGGMYDTPSGIANLLVNNVSLSEFSERLRIAASAAYTVPQAVRDSMMEMFNLGPGELVGYYLDPDKASPILQQNFQASQVAGAARTQQIKIEAEEAIRLAQQGVSWEQALQGFGQVAQTKGLEAGAGETVSQRDRVAAAFGDSAAMEKMRRVQTGRQAQFRGGGSAAETSQGATGLGGAST